MAAVSAGIVAGEPVLDLDYREDSTAEVDFNVVRLGNGGLVEVQGTGEGGTFSRGQLDTLMALAEQGIGRLTELQACCSARRLASCGVREKWTQDSPIRVPPASHGWETSTVGHR